MTQALSLAVAPELEAAIRKAFLYVFPVHDLARTRLLFTQLPDSPRNVAPNVLHHNRKLLNHRARQVTMPNNDTLYSTAWLDVSAGPLLLSLPDMHDRYYSIALMDVFTNNFACVGRRTTGTDAITFAIAGPDWTGTAPDGTHLIRSPSNDVWLLGRILVDGWEDLPEVHRLQEAMRLEPLDPAVHASGPNLYRTAPGERTPSTFLELINETLGRNPIPEHERAMVAGYANIGIRPGVSGAWDALDDAVRSAWTTLMPQLFHELKSLPASYLQREEDQRGHWVSGRDHIGNFGDDYAYRAFICLSGLGALERTEAVYLTSRVDAVGEPLDGRHSYRVHVPAGMPVDAFWSLSMYEFEPDGRGFFVDNPIGRYTIGDRTPGLVFNSDGTADLWLRHAAPREDRMANWLPAPAGPFALALRFYQPQASLLDRSFVMPDAQRLDT
ncbi:DUF1254 domain-containing protein [Herbaspirillum sp. GCM10030257]|uniref:DUF1254 domain-containing protein n=1 Tax=Herbaspirillum sp. GCM10030257 TaxID=3273393 RepID=UPI003605FA0E